MGFVGDLFPHRREEPKNVARVMARMCPLDSYRNAAPEIQDVVRVAGEWQGTVKPRRGLLATVTGKPGPAPAGEAEFLAAAERANRRFG
jgi:hypothetical protein